jgi:phage gp36-like protein
MPYCALEDLIKTLPEERIIELSDDSDTPSSVNEDNVDKAIASADSDIDGYIGGRYSLPLDVIPNKIKDISVDLAIYYLWTRRPERKAPEEIRIKYSDGIKRLKDIQDGKFLLGITQMGSSGTDITGSEVRTNKTSLDRKFTKDLLSRF